jgi:lipopolysaccharide transport system ATP-binding protein
MTAITNLCGRGLLLDEGRVFYEGPSEKVVKVYLQKQVPEGRGVILIGLPDDPVLKINAVGIRQGDAGVECFLTHEPIRILIDYTLKQQVQGFRIGFDLCSSDDTVIWRSFEDDAPSKGASFRDPGDYHSECVIPRDLLSAQAYSVKLLAGIHQIRWITRGDIVVSLNLQNLFGVNSHYADQRPGILMPRLEWFTRHRTDKSQEPEAT